jgi:Arc/MetJ-type ribon-helix-helix transcriptional regulator
MSKKPKWRTISLRVELVEKIEKLIESRPDLGYSSVADFVADAVRRRLEELSKSPLER